MTSRINELQLRAIREQGLTQGDLDSMMLDALWNTGVSTWVGYDDAEDLYEQWLLETVEGPQK